MTTQAGGTVISVMLAVEDTPKAVEWYRRALGATPLWSLGSVAGLEIQGAPFFLAQPAGNGWESPARLGITSARVEVFSDDPDAFIARALGAGATGSLDTLRDHARPWGAHRQGGFTDPFGHIWLVGDRSPLAPHASGSGGTRTHDEPLTFRVVRPEELAAVREEVREAFFSGDPATIAGHFRGHEDPADSTTILGYEAGRQVGIVTVRWRCRYPPFRERGIPLIQNIEIRWEDRGRGIGGRMLARAEQEIAGRAPVAGICVGLSAAYGPAQRLYARRGFVPDGRGACAPHEPLPEGATVTLDGSQLLWLTKDVSRGPLEQV